MTCVVYVKARKGELAIRHVYQRNSVIESESTSNYNTSSNFREAFYKKMGTTPTKAQTNILKAASIDTPLGPMITIADEEELYLLEFLDRRGLERKVELLRQRKSATIIPGETVAIKSIERELKQYFFGKLKIFTTPVCFIGSDFQKIVWCALQEIPFGSTCSYADQAKAIGKPTAFRAVANANGMNPFCIIIPCHRVINSNGEIGGYGGGLARKEWLLKHEHDL